ncbi:hypothetical protein G6L68_01780 [Agrobacterium fabrum]|uniref:hypothetical protein n=1 Tax=Agrobacterium fabrum TaxID=1176649 RepID=UPI000EF577B5|nr:hypothetical protein [Agrobacterium fabrum]AYM61265.1 hypothetical protein At12D13_01000 [Agrobacterium fabrum]NTE59366.1 hypothetical protein [Agrobacterium fabrum]
MPHRLFLVTSEEIQRLNDEQARELVARLARAETEKLKACNSSVTWGGDQRAKDGGIDVRVTSSSVSHYSTYLPRSCIGYQVKAEKFAPSKIPGEMTHAGSISASIADLLRTDGAYVIVSTKDSVSDSSLSARKAKMTECAKDAGLDGLGVLDFFDARRVADWVEQYPAIGVWVKDTVGSTIQGWKPYGPWAYRENDVNAQYLIDDRVKVFAPNSDDGSNALEAINTIRQDLASGRTVRLVGLSGVGKTRLVQALFDARISTSVPALSSDAVVYADLSDHLEPQPTSMAENLVGGVAPTFLIVDNCGQELHKRLAEIVARSSARVSLLTVEYDIRDDLPEATTCYRLEGSSDEVINELLGRRYPHLSRSDIQRVAEFSDGNARVAFALASASEVSDELAKLTDDALFRRLFHQKQMESDELLRCAEAASLLYSFDGEDVSDTSELALLASTSGLSAVTLYRGVAELQRRGLVQQRGKWRAVLPQAISNKLAARAIESIPPMLITDVLVNKATERVAKSCSRRIGYLHSSPSAQRMVAEILKPGGRFDRADALDDTWRQILKNFLPVDPSSGLAALGRMIGSVDAPSLDNHVASDLVRMVRSLAYDAQMFPDALRLLLEFIKEDEVRGNSNSSREAIVSLFSCHLSGTHAPIEMRISSLRRVLQSNKPLVAALGLEALRKSFETAHFTSQFDHDFGARRRDYGWSPRSQSDVVQWYSGFAKLALEAASKEEVNGPVRHILGRSIRGLCQDAGIISEVEAIAEALVASGGWPDGWIGVRETLHWAKSDAPADILERLHALERLLAPTDLVGEIRSAVLVRNAGMVELLEDGEEVDYSTRNSMMHENAKRLGGMAATDPMIVSQLLRELLVDQSDAVSVSFGIGLGEVSADRHRLLDQAKEILATMRSSDVTLLVIRGVLRGWREADQSACDRFLDAAVVDPVWGQWFPELQCAVGLDGDAVERILQALRAGIAPHWQYRYLTLGGAPDVLAPDVIEAVANSIVENADGSGIAVEFLGMAIHSSKARGEDFELDIAGRIGTFLARIDLSKCKIEDTMVDHHLGRLFMFVLNKTSSQSLVNDMLQNVLSWERTDRRRYAYNRGRFLQPFFSTRPELTLDAIYQPDPDGSYSTATDLAAGFDNERGSRPIEGLPTTAAIEWGSSSPTDRYLFLAETCLLYEPETPDKKQDDRRLSELAREVFKASPNKRDVLKAYIGRLMPMSWSGSRAEKLRKRLGILNDLASLAAEEDAEIVEDERTRMLKLVTEMKAEEDAHERGRNERFE